jgi:hypothetical protein
MISLSLSSAALESSDDDDDDDVMMMTSAAGHRQPNVYMLSLEHFLWICLVGP